MAKGSNPDDEHRGKLILGLVSSMATLQAHYENLKENYAEFKKEVRDAQSAQLTDAKRAVQDARNATRTLRNSVIGGVCVAAIIAAVEYLLR